MLKYDDIKLKYNYSMYVCWETFSKFIFWQRQYFNMCRSYDTESSSRSLKRRYLQVTILSSWLAQLIEKDIVFLQAGHKVDFIAPYGQTNPFSDPLEEKKSCATREKHLLYSCGCYPCFGQVSNLTLTK